MTQRLDLITRLNRMLLDEISHHRQAAHGIAPDVASQRRLLRSLMNLRPPAPLKPEYLVLQDELLAAEREEKGVIDVMALPTTSDPRIVLWQGDITRLNVDAIVNAANSAMLGCFHPNHGCIDNVIHSAAGLQLREECSQLMRTQGHEEPTGQAKITRAYNLPCRHILHTVGPIISGSLSKEDCDFLAGCYRSCLEQVVAARLRSVAFCCISTGEYRFPGEKAAEIAVETVRDFLSKNKAVARVIFDVFTDRDLKFYQDQLGL
jgi:O-acetyl-ADP-ribose deacetylase (regulator of RNase III)